METNNDFIQILEQKLKDFYLRVLSKADCSSQSELSETSENTYQICDINQLTEIFVNQNINNNELYPIYTSKPLEKYYYRRPSPQDLLFEESEPYQNSYSEKVNYEWNINGLNDKQIIYIIHRIIMYSTLCKQHENNDSSIASVKSRKYCRRGLNTILSLIIKLF